MPFFYDIIITEIKRKENVMATVTKPRWTLFMRKEEADKWSDIEFHLVAIAQNEFTDEYVTMLIEPFTEECMYSIQEIMEITGALAVHEEFSKAVFTDEVSIDEIAGFVYTWAASGCTFVGDMLTDIERLQILVDAISSDNNGATVDANRIYISFTKDSKLLPLGEHIEDIFTKGIYYCQYGNTEPQLVWWAGMIEHKNYFIAIQQDEVDEEDSNIIPLPVRNPYSRYGYDGWDDYYDY